MKRWIKKHSKILVIIISLLFIGNSIRGIVITSPGAEWHIVVHSFAIAIWLIVLLPVSGAVNKILNWWERD